MKQQVYNEGNLKYLLWAPRRRGSIIALEIERGVRSLSNSPRFIMWVVIL